MTDRGGDKAAGPRARAWQLVLAGLVLAGCDGGRVRSLISGGASADALYRDLQDESPAVRVRAARAAAARKDTAALPYLVDRLDDSEPDVRFFSFLALKAIVDDEATVAAMGWDYADPPARRQEGVRRWRRWLRAGGPEKATTRPSPSR